MVAAEILYVDPDAPIAPPVIYAYLLADTISVQANNVTRASFIGDDGQLYSDLIISSLSADKLDASVTLFYELVEEALDGEWTATQLTQTATMSSLPPDPNPLSFRLEYGYATGNSTRDTFELDHSPEGNSTDAWYYKFDETDTVAVGVGFAGEREILGKNTDISALPRWRLVVIIYGGVNEEESEAKVAFVFGDNVGRNDIAGIRPTS